MTMLLQARAAPLLSAGATLATTATPANENYLLAGFGLMGLALFLLVLEFLVPSGGLIGLLCGVAAVASVVAFFRYDSALGIGMGIAYVVLAPVIVIFGFKLWTTSSIGKRMILGGVDEEPERVDERQREREARQRELEQLIGASGTTETALRPVGIVRIGGQRLDALAESGVVEAGRTVVVTQIYDNQIKVREA
jgi:membrane-bound serine protease (ClpP class)